MELDYSNGTHESARASRFAVWSFVLAVLCCPCLSGNLLDRFTRLPSTEERARYVSIVIEFAAPAAALACGLAADVRIVFSRGKLEGTLWARAAVAIAVFWLFGLRLVVSMMQHIVPLPNTQ